MSLKPTDEKETVNPMSKPKIAKVVVNISVGKSGEPLDKAKKIIGELTSQNPCERRAKKTIREFGIRKQEPIACLVTLRGESARKFLKKVFLAVDNRLSQRSFDKNGNLSFGIKEHIDIIGTKYSPELGIIGFNVTIVMEKPGYRIKRRHRTKSKIGSKHLLNLEEAESFIRDEFGVEIN